MAQITDYQSLKDNLIAYFERSGDTDFDTRCDTFIGLAEASFPRVLFSRRMELTVTLTTDADGQVALPADYLATRSAYVTNGNLLNELVFIAQDAVATMFPIETGGNPYWAAISGDTMTIYPIAERDVTFTYYQKFIGLSALNTTNWIITNHPDLYMFWCMAHACSYQRDTEGMALFSSKATAIQDEITDRFGIEYGFNNQVTMDFVTP